MTTEMNGSRGSDDGASTTRRTFLVGAAAAGGALALGGLPALGAADAEATTFTVRIENIADQTGTTLDPSGDVSGVPVVLSPGAFAVHSNGEPMFTSGEPERNNGLEEVAEDGDPTRLIEALGADDRVAQAGAFTTPEGAMGPGPLTPGNAYEFEIQARPPAQYLSLVTMFVQSNDLFYALGGAGGFDLFDGSDPASGDVTSAVGLWDAGTEVNEEPGAGENQAPRQGGPGVGLVERGTVAPIEEVNGYDYPPVEGVLSVTLTPSQM
ncbi:MAG: spondin domain-containing protein [Haloferacaceae archaeon]